MMRNDVRYCTFISCYYVHVGGRITMTNLAGRVTPCTRIPSNHINQTSGTHVREIMLADKVSIRIVLYGLKISEQKRRAEKTIKL